MLGRTGLKVSEIGYGAWGIGKGLWIGAADEESLKALHRAADLGLNFVDTALAYGEGHSEALVGRVVKERSEPIYVATKVPPKNGVWPARDGTPVAEAFPAEHVISCTEQSLRNLKLDSIDVQQFHVWSDEWVGQGDWLDAIQKLKEQGKIRFFGVSINDYQPENAIKLIETGVLDTVQVIYNIFEQNPEEKLFPACERHDVAVIARVPFDEGSLTGTLALDSRWPEGDWRNTYFSPERRAETLARVGRLEPLIPEGMDLPELAPLLTVSWRFGLCWERSRDSPTAATSRRQSGRLAFHPSLRPECLLPTLMIWS
jgi:aryl-alcohol dehydrogenase-like predicted oxidoreductase